MDEKTTWLLPHRFDRLAKVSFSVPRYFISDKKKSKLENSTNLHSPAEHVIRVEMYRVKFSYRIEFECDI